MEASRPMRFVWIALALLVTAVAAFMIHTRVVQNPRVARDLAADPGGALAGRVLILTLPSGKTIPVNYWIDPSAAPRVLVYVASDFFWWRELRDEGARVEVVLRGERRTGRARVIDDDVAERDRIFHSLRPTAPRWFGVLVEIELDPRADAGEA